MSLKSFAISHAIFAALNHVEKTGMIEDVGEAIDKNADRELKGNSEKIQERLVNMFLKLCRYLMRENTKRYHELLEAEQAAAVGGIDATPPLKRQNFGPKK